MKLRILRADCLDVIKTFPDNHVDSIVTDPPYGLNIGNNDWDTKDPKTILWKECLRVLKPGGFLLAFGGCRVYHRLASNIEDSGFVIHPMIAWVYGSGFSKAANLEKILNKNGVNDAEKWKGWYYGLQTLRPTIEPICMAQKPYEGATCESIQKWGVGAINIDGCRVGDRTLVAHKVLPQLGMFNCREEVGKPRDQPKENFSDHSDITKPPRVGRFPSNLIHDGSEKAMELFPETVASKKGTSRDLDCTVARFYYCAKVSKSERGENNIHPTVKPVALMSYLCKLVTPPGKTILDPFMGSGSTGIACKMLGFGFIGIEKEKEFFDTARSRISKSCKIEAG